MKHEGRFASDRNVFWNTPFRPFGQAEKCIVIWLGQLIFFYTRWKCPDILSICPSALRDNTGGNTIIRVQNLYLMQYWALPVDSTTVFVNTFLRKWKGKRNLLCLLAILQIQKSHAVKRNVTILNLTNYSDQTLKVRLPFGGYNYSENDSAVSHLTLDFLEWFWLVTFFYFNPQFCCEAKTSRWYHYRKDGAHI